MKSGRFFVTSVLIFMSVLICACKARHENHSSVQEGAETMKRAMLLGNELDARFQLAVQVSAEKSQDRQLMPERAHVHAYNWKRLSLAERREVKGKLNEYISLLSTVLQVDARKGVYLTNKDLVISWRDGALAYQRALENFEKIHGESFEPKRSQGRLAHLGLLLQQEQ